MARHHRRTGRDRKQQHVARKGGDGRLAAVLDLMKATAGRLDNCHSLPHLSA